MRRVVRESVKIQNARKEENVDENGVTTKLMNRKNEYFGMMTVQVNFEQE